MSYVGQVRYGTESWNSNLKKKVGFVEQEDIVLPALTVHQSLKFSAALRLPGSMNQAEKMQRVGSVISMLRMLGRTSLYFGRENCCFSEKCSVSQRSVVFLREVLWFPEKSCVSHRNVV